MMYEKSLKEWRSVIAKEAPYVGVKPYSHNIIGLALGAIAKDHGQAEANKAIVDFELEDKGWSQHEDTP